jgi:thioredoxin reductase (NADPH)
MESIIIWGLTLVLCLGIILPYVIQFRRKRRDDIRRMEEAAQYGIDKPLGQYPFIDNSRCIGCGSCVAACPEGDVLGVVFGKAMIINGLRCVGHGYCEQACPVMAIEVGLGSVKEREDIPQLNEWMETNISGLYIAGELSGLSLIRNAIQHGRNVIEHIAAQRNVPQAAQAGLYDVIIVGFGPAGLSATLSCIDKGLSYLILDQQEPGGTLRQYPSRKLVMTQDMEIPLYGKLKGGEYSKEQLLEIWQEALNKYSVRIRMNERVTGLNKTGEIFSVSTVTGVYHAAKVVLALGRRGTPRKLNIPGEDLAKVMYQLSDAQSYHHAHILVVGGGDSAIEAAIGLARQKGNKVIISYRKDQFFRIKKKNEERINELIHKRQIRILFDSTVREISARTAVVQQNDKNIEFENDYVFIFAGGDPPFKMLQEMGIQFGKKPPGVAA